MKKQWRRIAICIVILIAVMVILAPRYREYIRQDHYDTCYRARGIIFSVYHGVIPLTSVEGEDPGAERVKHIVEEYFHTDVVTEEGIMKVEGLCREGGEWTIRYDEERDAISIYCDAPGHGMLEDFYVPAE